MEIDDETEENERHEGHDELEHGDGSNGEEKLIDMDDTTNNRST